MPHVMITGASSGIGRALALEYASRGSDLLLLARRLDLLTNLKSEILARTSVRVRIQSIDVVEESALRTAVVDAIQAHGPLDTVIANAGYGVIAPFEALTVAHYERQFAVNVFGVLKTIYATLDTLKQTRGRLCIVGSTNAYLTLPSVSAYCASKHAVRSIADGLRAEFAPYGISVTLINPGFIDTDIRYLDVNGKTDPNQVDPIPQWIKMSADQAARKIYAAVTARKRERAITVHSQVGIWFARFFPGVLAWLIRRKSPLKIP